MVDTQIPTLYSFAKNFYFSAGSNLNGAPHSPLLLVHWSMHFLLRDNSASSPNSELRFPQAGLTWKQTAVRLIMHRTNQSQKLIDFLSAKQCHRNTKQRLGESSHNPYCTRNKARYQCWRHEMLPMPDCRAPGFEHYGSTRLLRPHASCGRRENSKEEMFNLQMPQNNIDNNNHSGAFIRRMWSYLY